MTLAEWQRYWALVWAEVVRLAWEAQAEALYGPCALCWGMGV